jgi:hypothetical protein
LESQYHLHFLCPLVLVIRADLIEAQFETPLTTILILVAKTGAAKGIDDFTSDDPELPVTNVEAPPAAGSICCQELKLLSAQGAFTHA